MECSPGYDRVVASWEHPDWDALLAAFGQWLAYLNREVTASAAIPANGPLSGQSGPSSLWVGARMLFWSAASAAVLVPVAWVLWLSLHVDADTLVVAVVPTIFAIAATLTNLGPWRGK